MKFTGSAELLRRYLSGTVTPDERAQIENWYASFDRKEKENSFEAGAVIREEIYRKILDELELRPSAVPFYRKSTFRLSAAAIFILLIAGLCFIFFTRDGSQEKSLAARQWMRHDVAPPTVNKATLTLADGTLIELDSSMNGMLAVQGKVNIIKQDSALIAYNGEDSKGEMTYNTLTVPRGSRPMKLLLADGSEVWLNVASSITYPTAFAGGERRVEISGEVYFEVAKNKEKPFIVMKKNDKTEIRVLGTHFNVNAYRDDSLIKVTLLEGAVSVTDGTHCNEIEPGQQAVIGENSMHVLKSVDIEEVMSWKNGRFYFDGADIKTIMKQVEKWYNVDITYDAEIPYSFVAKISRNVNASELFKILQLTELVHFKIEGNNITVMK